MSAASTLAIIAPDLAVLSNASSALALCESRINRKNWGAVRDQAVAYLAAHLLKMQTRAGSAIGAGGQITSATEGGLSLSFGSNTGSMSDPSLGSTSYGQEFLRLKRETIPGFA